MGFTAERAGMWAAVGTLLVAVLSMAYSAGQMANELERLRADLSNLERYFLEWMAR